MEATENGEGVEQDFPVGATMNRLKRMKFVMHQIPPHEFVGEDEERKSYPPKVYMAHFIKFADDIVKAFEFHCKHGRRLSQEASQPGRLWHAASAHTISSIVILCVMPVFH